MTNQLEGATSRAKNQFHMSLLQLFSDLAPGIPPSVNESAEFHFIIEKTAKGLHGEFGYVFSIIPSSYKVIT